MDCLTDLLMEKGLEVISDYDREQAGLPRRGPDGWTADELVALEKSRLEMLFRPFSVTVPNLDPPRSTPRP